MVSTWQAVRATRAERLAESRLAQAESVTGFLQDMLAAVQPEEAQGREVTVHEVLDRAAADLDAGSLADQPQVEMALQRTLGMTYRSLGQYDTSARHLQRGRALADSLLPPSAVERQQLTVDLAYTEMNRGNIDATEALINSELDAIPARSPLRVEALAVLADVVYSRGQWQAADSLQIIAQDIAAETTAPDSLRLASVLLDRSFLAEQSGEYDRAAALADRTAAIFRAAYGAEDPRMIKVLMRQSDIARGRGLPQDAAPILEDALAIADANYPPVHPMRADVLWRLGMTYHNTRNADAAIPPLEESLALRREVLGPEHRDIALTLSSLGNAVTQLGELDAAEAYHREALAMREDIFGHEHITVASSLQDLGHLARYGRHSARAESLYVAAAEIIDRLPDEAGDADAQVSHSIAMAIQDQGDHARAESYFQGTLDLYRERHGEMNALVARSGSNLATNLFRQGRKAEAADVQGQALAIQRELGNEGTSLLLAIGNAAYLLDDAGRHAEADTLHREYVALAGEIYGDESPRQPDARTRYADNLMKRGLWDEAAAQVDTLMAWRRAQLPEDDTKRITGEAFVAEVLLGQGHAAAADSTLRIVEGYLASDADIDPRVKASATARVERVRGALDTALAGR
jgi:tetratricopeptide (TPR) repeat protein